MQLTYRDGAGFSLYAEVVGSGDERPLVLLHAGGPDHHSLLPLADRLSDRYTVILPDVRGYGRSVCRDPQRHTWRRYAEDVKDLADHLGLSSITLGGAGLGSTITARAAIAFPELVSAAILMGVEDIQDDAAVDAEVAFLDAFAERVATDGIEAAWAPILAAMPPVVGAMVRDAIPRSDQASIAAAAAIGRDRSFRDVAELAEIAAPTLIFAGTDPRHPTALAERVAATIPHATLATATVSDELHSPEELAETFAPEIRKFLEP
ncbi:alpha/beta fold hydrolase [Nocardia altamirensis]|uniref:alpha/beta fold hydrolase n=1 Tax=Nocardia altamirensis TaxID=472158 RepID=UPI0008405625|nr:alpha/beta hydrolase [Nocardia altamirensis]